MKKHTPGSNRLRRFKIEKLKYQTPEEIYLYKRLLKEAFKWGRSNVGFINVKRQFRIPPYIVDFFVNVGVVVEVDGGYHNNRIEYDTKRDRFLEDLGLIVLHFDNKIIQKYRKEVVETIRKAVEKKKLEGFDFLKISHARNKNKHNKPKNEGLSMGGLSINSIMKQVKNEL